MKEHIHAEVLRAIADGKEVQMLFNDEWLDVDHKDLQNIYDPFSNHDAEWRIKPEPKPDYFLYAGYDGNSPSSYLRPNINSIITSAWKHIIKIKFNGETDEPLFVELVK